jgi:hypothetical protein
MHLADCGCHSETGRTEVDTAIRICVLVGKCTAHSAQLAQLVENYAAAEPFSGVPNEGNNLNPMSGSAEMFPFFRFIIMCLHRVNHIQEE